MISKGSDALGRSSLPTESRSKQIKEDLRRHRIGDGAKVGRVAPRAPRIGDRRPQSRTVLRHHTAESAGAPEPDSAGEGRSKQNAPRRSAARAERRALPGPRSIVGSGFDRNPPEQPLLVLSASPHAICGKADLVGQEQAGTGALRSTQQRNPCAAPGPAAEQILRRASERALNGL